MNSDDYTLQFKLWVEAAVSYKELSALLMSEFSDSKRIKENVIKIEENWIEIWANEFADKAKINDPEEGYLYYAMEIHATPMTKNVKEIHQIFVATKILKLLRSRGFLADVGASFEAKMQGA